MALPFDEAALLRLGCALKDAGYRFVTVTPATHARVNSRPANAWARDVRDVFGWSRRFGPGVLRADLLAMATAAGVVDHDGDGWRSRVRFSTYDDELFVHSAFPTDAPDTVFLGPDTYRMADAALAHLRGRAGPVRRAVDIGCGTGAGAIAVAKRTPGAEVVALDVNPAALSCARVNAALAGIDNVSVRHGDLRDGLDGWFDLAVSNPPFMVDQAGRGYRDGGGPDGSELSLAVLDAAMRGLRAGGSLVLFSGTGIVAGHDPLRAALAHRLAGADFRWTYREVDPDVYGEELDGAAYADAERIAVVVLEAQRRS
ncbi:methyltransferase [Asanoa sp. NPDC050611]|uniref:methyltransferase n=1 Tax=Asanoa sp. NPDC050611 TaxID=3157098 RepID=UPI0033E91B19